MVGHGSRRWIVEATERVIRTAIQPAQHEGQRVRDDPTRELRRIPPLPTDPTLPAAPDKMQSEPQSDDIGFHGLPSVAESSNLSRFDCSCLPRVSACCALSGVSSGVNSCDIRHGKSLCTLPIYCDGAPALATITIPLLPHRDSVIRDVAYELCRTPLLRGWLNKIQKRNPRGVLG